MISVTITAISFQEIKKHKTEIKPKPKHHTTKLIKATNNFRAAGLELKGNGGIQNSIKMSKDIRRILTLRKMRVQNGFSFTALSGKMWESFLPLMVTDGVW